MADFTLTERIDIGGMEHTFVFVEQRSGRKRGLLVKVDGKPEYEYMAEVNLDEYHNKVSQFYSGLAQKILDDYKKNQNFPNQVKYLHYTFT